MRKTYTSFRIQKSHYLRPKNKHKIGIIWVCNMIGMLLRARWKRIDGTILKHRLFKKKQKFEYLGPNFHIWAFGAQNSKIGIIWVCNVIGMSLRTRWKHIDGRILKHRSFSKKCKNLGIWGRISIFGHLGPKTQK